MLGIFPNTLTANDIYPVEDSGNLSSPIQMQLSLKPKNFSNFLIHFWNLHQILNILKEKMIAIPTLFRKLRNVKNVVRPLSKEHCSRTPFDSQHVKGSQTLGKSASEYFNHIFSSLWETLISKIFLLVIC